MSKWDKRLSVEIQPMCKLTEYAGSRSWLRKLQSVSKTNRNGNKDQHRVTMVLSVVRHVDQFREQDVGFPSTYSPANISKRNTNFQQQEATNDMVEVDLSREQQAKEAGHTIYHSVHREMNRNMIRNTEIHPMGEEASGRMSASRRTFCLIATFDLIFSFIFWVIYTQLTGDHPVWNALENQVMKYTFAHSLFDTVMISVIRFTFIILAYALYRSRHWFMIALTTSMTCAFLLVKVFIYDFNVNNPLSYATLLVSFVLAWIETWFLDFKVLPKEEEMRKAGLVSRRPITERTPLLGDPELGDHLERSDFHSPLDSPQGSGDEDDDAYSSLPPSRRSRTASKTSLNSIISQKGPEYQKMANGLCDNLWKLTESSEKWKLEKGTKIEQGIVYSRHVKNVGKLFKLQAILNCSPKATFKELVFYLEETPQWNPTVIESRILAEIDDNSDIIYNVSAEVAGGLISSRDFTTLRTWGTKGDIFFTAASAVIYPDMPPQKKYVRAEYGAGGILLKPVEASSNKCEFTWYFSTFLKGWLPQTLIDQTIGTFLLEYLELLDKRLKAIQKR